MTNLPRGCADIRLGELEWDSEVLGFCCGQLEIAEEMCSDNDTFDRHLKEALENAVRQQMRFVSAKIAVAHPRGIDTCIRHGGFYIDSEITFSKTRKNVNVAPVQLPPDFSLSVRASYWDERIHEIGDTLRYSRFFMDSHLSEDQGRTIWRASLFNSCTGRASYSVVCFHHDRPVGLMNIFEYGAVSNIFVVGVAPGYQNMRLGRTMMDYYQANLPKCIERLTVETYLSNYRAQNLYTGCGYRAEHAKHIIHFWPQESGNS